MALTKRAALAMAATLLLVAGCSGDDEPAAGGSAGPTTASTPTGSAPAGEPNAGSPSESRPTDSSGLDACTLGATAINAKLPGATTESDPVEPNDPVKEASCQWTGPKREYLLVTTDQPADFTTMKAAKARADARRPGAKFRTVPELGPDAWFAEDGTLSVSFRSATLAVKLEAARIEESDLLAIAKGAYADAKRVP